MTLSGGNLGDANAQDATNPPFRLVGGRFRAGQHLTFHPQFRLSILQSLCLEASGRESPLAARPQSANTIT